VDPAGGIEVPAEALQESGSQPGSPVVVLAREGRILLLEQERFRERVEKPMQEMLARFRRSLEQQPQAPFLDDLTCEEYAALCEADEQALWDRLTAAADKQGNALNAISCPTAVRLDKSVVSALATASRHRKRYGPGSRR